MSANVRCLGSGGVPRFRLLASVPLFLEYEAVLKRPEQLAAGQRSLAMVDAFLDALALRLDIVLAPAAFLQQLSQGEN